MKWGKYHLLRPAQISAIRASAPIAYVPWGALEWHSYHNPIGLDGLIAEGICLKLAEQTGGVVLPPVYLGTDTIKPFKGFPHTVEHGATTVETVCLEYLEQLLEEGFRVLVVVTGHAAGGHTDRLQAAVGAFTEAHPDARAWTCHVFEPIGDFHKANHAAFGETSLLMAFDAAAVDLSALPADRQATLDEDGMWGDDPRKATAESGRQIIEAFLDAALPIVSQLLQQARS
jgi:creatinine amidohydrolase